MSRGPASQVRDPFMWDAMQSLPVAIYTTDAEGLVTRFNQAAADLAGRTPRIGHDRWCVTWRLYWPDGRPMAHADCPMALAIKENRLIRGVEAIAERPDGTRFRFVPHPTPLRDAAGAVIGGINMLVERPRHPGVKNTLVGGYHAQVAAVINVIDTFLQEAWQDAQSPKAQETVVEITRRVALISATQGLLARGGGDVDAWDLLASICVASQSALMGNVEFVWQSTAGTIAGAIAVPLSIVAKELMAHACTDARPRRRKTVRVELCRTMGIYLLSVVDERPGIRVRRWHTSSSGLGLVAALVRQLNGTFDVERRGGVRYIVRIPDPRRLN